jgi:hypothetical protein
MHWPAISGWTLGLGIGIAVAGLWAPKRSTLLSRTKWGSRFGKPKSTVSSPGPHLMLWPVDSVERVSLTENQTTIGAANDRDTAGKDAAGRVILSGDQSLVFVHAELL